MFSRERDMRPVVEAWLRQRVDHVLRETWCTTPVCDLLGCSFRDEAVQMRVAMRQKSPLSVSRSNEMRPWMPLYDRIIAVEMKLNRMQEVLDQARSHLCQATESWIAMPQPYAGKTIERASALGIGVLEVGERCTVLLPAVAQPSEGSYRTRISERFWRKYGPRYY